MYRLADGVIIEEVVGDEGIIVDTIRGQYLRTNKTALMMISAVTEQPTIEDAVGELARHTNAARDVIDRDVRALVEKLTGMALLEERQ